MFIVCQTTESMNMPLECTNSLYRNVKYDLSGGNNSSMSSSSGSVSSGQTSAGASQNLNGCPVFTNDCTAECVSLDSNGCPVCKCHNTGGKTVDWLAAKYMSRNGRKRTFSHMRISKTQISLCIRAVCSESSLSEWKTFAVQNSPSEDSDQTARMRRLIWIFAGGRCI